MQMHLRGGDIVGLLLGVWWECGVGLCVGGRSMELLMGTLVRDLSGTLDGF
jgi:hypothetical protein